MRSQKSELEFGQKSDLISNSVILKIKKIK